MANLFCRWFGHHRSGVKAYFDYDAQQWRSYCRRCGVPMVKRSDEKWVVDD